VFRVERARGPVWYAKYRLPDGRQVQKKLGPAWTERGRPPAGYFTKRQAEDWLRDVLVSARRGTLAGAVRTGATLADAAAEWLRYVDVDRQRKPSTVAGYKVLVRSQLLPAFGSMALEEVTTEVIERWLSGLGGAASSRTKALVLLHGIFEESTEGVGVTGERGGVGGEARAEAQRRHSGVLAGGGVVAGSSCCVRAGRGHLSDRLLHWPASRGAARAALAGC
jgi:hypothetical protein